jgi:hypothetical protein
LFLTSKFNANFNYRRACRLVVFGSIPEDMVVRFGSLHHLQYDSARISH